MLSFSFLDRYLESILKKQKLPLFCPAYNDTLAIWWNGDIYPCFMFYGNEQFKICNIENFEIFETDILKYNLKYLNYLKKLDREKCNNCVIRWLCNICIGGVYNEKSKIEEIPEYYCSWQRGMIEEIIGYLCYIKGNKNLWDRLVKNIKEKHEKFKS
ncbi:MAG: SPASM domain-containing protein [candidate division WOR-3 bacterium]